MAILGMLGGIMVLIGWIWTIISGFQTGGVLWGILNIIPIQPLIGIVSGALKKVAWLPVGIMILGVVLSFLGGGFASLTQMPR